MRNRQYRKLKWPVHGIDQGRSYDGQPADSCVAALNVRNFDPRTGRLRGAQRAGLSRYVNATATGTRIQDVNQLVTHKASGDVTIAPTSLQNSNYVSVVVSSGTIQKFSTSQFTSVTSGSGALSAAAPVVFSAELFNDLFFADGVNDKLYDEASNTVKVWTDELTAGSLPGSSGDRWRLVEMWRARIVLAGVRSDPHNWFMSKMGDPLDWDYAPDPETVTMAVAGNNAPAGKIGDVINSMCPYDDDTLIFFGDHSIWQMTGDPAEGGRVDLVSDITGASFGRPWAKGPLGEIYFYGSRGGIFRMTVGNKPERLSTARIEEQLNDVNLNTSIIRAVYDDHTQLCHFFVTPLTAAVSTHIVWDLRTESFWFDQFADKNYNPRAVHVMEGDAPGDRVVVLGSDDGYLRYINYDGKNDDQKAIDSYVYFGPWTLEEGRKVQMRELILELDQNADSAYYTIYGGNSVMAAFPEAKDEYDENIQSAIEWISGELKPGRNTPERRRCGARALFMKLGNSNKDQTWAYETGYGFFVSSGISRLRQERN